MADEESAEKKEERAMEELTRRKDSTRTKPDAESKQEMLSEDPSRTITIGTDMDQRSGSTW